MKVKFCQNNHANIHSKRERIFETNRDFGITDVEWKEMSDEEKTKMVEEWAMEEFEYWYEEV